MCGDTSAAASAAIYEDAASEGRPGSTAWPDDQPAADRRARQDRLDLNYLFGKDHARPFSVIAIALRPAFTPASPRWRRHF
jgi:hypothetical protein